MLNIKNKQKKIIYFFLFSFLALSLFLSPVKAVENNITINSGKIVRVNQHEICRLVVNKHIDSDNLVPVSAKRDWVSYILHHPAYVNVKRCPEYIPKVSPDSLDFGNVNLDKGNNLNFTIQNAGTGNLTGEVAGLTAPFFCTEGCTYNLASGDSQAVSVRFNPTTTGSFSDVIEFTGGETINKPLRGTGARVVIPGPIIPPKIEITPTTLNFGSVVINTTSSLNFVVRNTGGGTLSGNVVGLATPFSCISGCRYALTAGRSQIVTIQFNPTAIGPFSGTAYFSGGDGARKNVSGTGEAVLAIEVIPTTLNFGNLMTNTSSTLNFTVRNTGGGTLTGRVNELSDPFSCVSGCNYNLTAGRSQEVIIRFSPTATGSFSNVIEFAGAENISRSVKGIGETAPRIEALSAHLAFRNVTIGTATSSKFIVRNIGGGTLAGNITGLAAPFSCVSGCNYNLTAGRSQEVIIRFSPTATGEFKDGAEFTGGGGTISTVSGTGEAAPEINITPTALNFGRVVINTTSSLSFTVTNTGGGILSGNVVGLAGPFSCISGCNYNLAENVFQTVVVRFNPTLIRSFETTAIFSGGRGARKTVSGTGDDPPEIEVIPANLNFGKVVINTTSALDFTIRNTGGGRLIGNVTGLAAPFSCISGCNYNLERNKSQTVTIHFSPIIAGINHTDTAIFSGAGGLERNVSGIGDLEPTLAPGGRVRDLTFLNIYVGAHKDLSFTIQNIGGGLITGEITGLSLPFSCVSGCNFSIEGGKSHSVTIRFTPTAIGSFSGSLMLNIPGDDKKDEQRFFSGTGIQAPYYLFITETQTTGRIGIGGLSGADLMCIGDPRRRMISQCKNNRIRAFINLEGGIRGRINTSRPLKLINFNENNQIAGDPIDIAGSYTALMDGSFDFSQGIIEDRSFWTFYGNSCFRGLVGQHRLHEHRNIYSPTRESISPVYFNEVRNTEYSTDIGLIFRTLTNRGPGDYMNYTGVAWYFSNHRIVHEAHCSDIRHILCICDPIDPIN